MREHTLTADVDFTRCSCWRAKWREEPVVSMPGGCGRVWIVCLATAEEAVKLGIPALALFPVIESGKTLGWHGGVQSEGLVPTVVHAQA